MIDAQSLDTIERSVLAAALRNADIREQLVSQATPDWWQALEHRTLFGALQSVVRQHLPIDVPTLIAEARKGSVSVADTPLDIDWLRESWKLADTVTPESVEKTHLPELRRAYQIRAFQGLAGALMEKCELGDSGDVATWLAGRIEAIMGMRDVTPIVTDAEVLMSIKSASELDYGPLTGIRELDESDFRLSPQKATIIAARPGHGKSSLSRQIAISAAAQGVGVLYVAAEEGIAGWQEARIQMLTGEPIHLLTTGKASSRALEIYQSFVSDAYERPIYVVGNVPALTAYDVIAEARRHKKHNAALGVVIVDQMQALVGWSDTKRGEGRDQGPKRIVDELVRGCRELGVHLVAVQQLNRDLEKGGRKREPRPADLADTAFFEQVADAILFVYRENYDPEDHDVDAEDTHAIIKFGKRRRGRKARLHVPWNGAYTRIGDWKDPIVEKIERELRLRGRPVPFGER